MLLDHPLFYPPNDVDQRIWRYLDFTKLVALLEDQALFFCSPRLLSEHDPFEGKPGFGFLGSPFINCWHMNKNESQAMWNLYLKSKSEGVAIQSSYRRLRVSLEASEVVNPIFIGQVKYIDHNEATIVVDTSNPNPELEWYLNKHITLEHERELRVIALNQDQSIESSGFSITVDLRKLVERIVLAPRSPSWFKSLVQKVAKRYNMDLLIEDSQLDQKPRFTFKTIES